VTTSPEGIYSPNQAKVLFDLWPRGVEWVIIGGPGTGNESFTIHKRFPRLNYVLFEPNKRMRDFHINMKFPGEIYPYALSDIDGESVLQIPKGRDLGSSIRGSMDASVCEEVIVKTKTLDTLSRELGLFTNVVLWIDIEHSELKCLSGAKKLLESGHILLVNLEGYLSTYNPIVELLGQYGLYEVKRWNSMSPYRYDFIFKKEEQQNERY